MLIPPISIQPYHPPQRPLIAVVGEAPGETEERKGAPFLGQAGQELAAMMQEAGLTKEECYLTNVFKRRPPKNDLKAWCVKKAEANEAWKLAGNVGPYFHKPLSQGKYLHPAFLPDVKSLWEELNALQPNLILALGNTACWALLDTTGITALRGTICRSPHVSSKVLPTYHPAAILRQWDNRPIVVTDLMKAKRESLFPEIKKPNYDIWTEPTLQDLYDFKAKYLDNTERFSVDIETAGGGDNQITCIGFGAAQAALVIPFVDRRKAGFSYWPDAASEVAALGFIADVLAGPQEKVFQNGMYDIQWLWRKWGLPVRNFSYDTMVRHHSLYCELPKSLGFLGSVYTDMPSWKAMRKRSGEDLNKAEE